MMGGLAGIVSGGDGGRRVQEAKVEAGGVVRGRRRCGRDQRGTHVGRG